MLISLFFTERKTILMLKIKKLKTFAIIAVASLASLPMMGQDLLARQAPIDRKMKAVDSVILTRIIQNEQAESPAADLYDEWNNKYAHHATQLPDSFRISLRHFCMPTTSRVLTSNFGSRWGRQHKGLDIKVYIGDTIRAAFSGKVRVVRYEGNGYGKYVVIRHNNGLETIYGHMSEQLVSENQYVNAGDPIGLGGNTGRSTGSHLHFETRLCGVALNPALMFDFKNQDVTGDYYVFNKNTYNRESALANRLHGVGESSEREMASNNNEEEELPMENASSATLSDIHFHKVSAGETLSSIARKRGTTIDELCKLNHIGKIIHLRPGQILKYN